MAGYLVQCLALLLVNSKQSIMFMDDNNPMDPAANPAPAGEPEAAPAAPEGESAPAGEPAGEPAAPEAPEGETPAV